MTATGKAEAMADVSLELLQAMMQQALDGIRMLREDNANFGRRLGRLEQAMPALQRAHVDRLEGEVGTQDQIDALIRRLERVDERVG